MAGVPAYPPGVGLCVTEGEYDLAGNLVRLNNPTYLGGANPQRYIGYTYTDDNLLAAVDVPNPAGSPARTDSTQLSYDADGRVTLESTPPGGANDTVRWETRTTWTADGLTAAVTEVPSDGDPMSPEQVRSITYDHDGNPTEASIEVSASTSDTETTSYYADGSVHESATGPSVTRYAYDANGNASRVWSPSAVAHAANNTAGVPTINLYSADNLLAAVIDPVSIDGTTRRATTFGYDASGRKVREDVAERIAVQRSTRIEAGTSRLRAFS